MRVEGGREGGSNERANTPRRMEEWKEEREQLIERNAGMLFVCLAQMMTVQCLCVISGR